jgi:hypothetical protein
MLSAYVTLVSLAALFAATDYVVPAVVCAAVAFAVALVSSVGHTHVRR